jgi:tRNA (guanine26-N2/guanine27-N2)-dimethyltransferase
MPQSSSSHTDPKVDEKVRVNEGDAWCVLTHFLSFTASPSHFVSALMYNHRNNRVDVVDIDPYGTAAPFIDAAIQALNDGGEFSNS